MTEPLYGIRITDSTGKRVRVKDVCLDPYEGTREEAIKLMAKWGAAKYNVRLVRLKTKAPPVDWRTEDEAPESFPCWIIYTDRAGSWYGTAKLRNKDEFLSLIREIPCRACWTLAPVVKGV